MKTWKVFSIYLGLALAIMLPLLAPGYVQTFDLSWIPHPPLPVNIDNTYLWQAAIHYLSLVLPSQLIEKTILLGILLASSLGAHFLTKYFLKSDHSWPPFFAGIFYVVNPFTYDRFLDGQYLVLTGYALLPVFTLLLWRFLDTPSLRRTITLVLVTLLVTITSIHSIFFIFLIALISLIVKVGRPTVLPIILGSRATTESLLNAKKYLVSLTKYSILAILIITIASSYWLVPFLTGHSATAQEISTFDSRQLYTFQTVPDHTYGIPAALNPLTLYGYWGEDQGRFDLPKAHDPAWGVLFIFIFVLVIVGALTYFKKQRGKVVTLISLIILGWIFSVGIATPPFSYINLWLLDHVHLLRGYREPQKFIGLIALGYAVLSALGLSYLLQKTATWKDETLQTMRSIFIALALFLPLLYTPTMVLGFAGQLHSADFPPDWYKVNSQLNSDHQNFQVLFLPWHHYMYFSFVSRVVSNPASRFFDKPTLISTSDELGLIPSNTETSITAPVENEILNSGHANLGIALKNLNIKYVILDKDNDWQDYDWLNNSPDLKLLSNGNNLRLYQNLKFK